MRTRKAKLLIDMDDVLADFTRSPRLRNWDSMHNPPEVFNPGFFIELPLIQGSQLAVSKLLTSKLFDIYICSKPVAENSHSYKEKVEWISRFFPALQSKIILTQNKQMVMADYLIDDYVGNSRGFYEFVHFNYKKHSKTGHEWENIVSYLICKETYRRMILGEFNNEKV